MSHVPDTRKRDRVRDLLHRSSDSKSTYAISPSPIHMPAANTTPKSVPASKTMSVSSSNPVTALSSSSFFVRALAQLSSNQQYLVRTCLSPGILELNTALTEIHTVAIYCQRASTLDPSARERADRVLKWVERIQSDGGLASHTDPIHAGLPWTGIRVVLEAAGAHAEQRATILAGLDTALDIVGNLAVYADFAAGVKAGRTKDIFEKELVELYARVLEFLAEAIEWGVSSRTRRAVESFATGTSLGEFEMDCAKLAARIQTAAQKCRRGVVTEREEGAKGWTRGIKNGFGRFDEALLSIMASRAVMY